MAAAEGGHRGAEVGFDPRVCPDPPGEPDARGRYRPLISEHPTPHRAAGVDVCTVIVDVSYRPNVWVGPVDALLEGLIVAA